MIVPLFTQVINLAPQSYCFGPHLVHSIVYPMNIGLQSLNVRLVALLLVEHGDGASLSIVGLTPCIIAIHLNLLD
jgi:hypothetical protein